MKVAGEKQASEETKSLPETKQSAKPPTYLGISVSGHPKFKYNLDQLLTNVFGVLDEEYGSGNDF